MLVPALSQPPSDQSAPIPRDNVLLYTAWLLSHVLFRHIALPADDFLHPIARYDMLEDPLNFTDYWYVAVVRFVFIDFSFSLKRVVHSFVPDLALIPSDGIRRFG